MGEQYTYPEDKPTMAQEDITTYSQGITIPIHLPTTGNYSVEFLRKELTNFAMSLLNRSTTKKDAAPIKWRDIVISEQVKDMTLGPSVLSEDVRTYKELLAEALEEKYK